MAVAVGVRVAGSVSRDLAAVGAVVGKIDAGVEGGVTQPVLKTMPHSIVINRFRKACIPAL